MCSAAILLLWLVCRDSKPFCKVSDLLNSPRGSSFAGTDCVRARERKQYAVLCSLTPGRRRTKLNRHSHFLGEGLWVRFRLLTLEQ